MLRLALSFRHVLPLLLRGKKNNRKKNKFVSFLSLICLRFLSLFLSSVAFGNNTLLPRKRNSFANIHIEQTVLFFSSCSERKHQPIKIADFSFLCFNASPEDVFVLRRIFARSRIFTLICEGRDCHQFSTKKIVR